MRVSYVSLLHPIVLAFRFLPLAPLPPPEKPKQLEWSYFRNFLCDKLPTSFRGRNYFLVIPSQTRNGFISRGLSL